MRRIIRYCNVPMLALLCIFLTSGVYASGKMVTITGTVNTDYEIVTDDGQAYEVAENLKGKEVVELIDSKVRVHGSVTEVQGVKKIRVTSYEVLEK
jgi:hypothetical protein